MMADSRAVPLFGDVTGSTGGGGGLLASSNVLLQSLPPLFGSSAAFLGAASSPPQSGAPLIAVPPPPPPIAAAAVPTAGRKTRRTGATTARGKKAKAAAAADDDDDEYDAAADAAAADDDDDARTTTTARARSSTTTTVASVANAAAEAAAAGATAAFQQQQIVSAASIIQKAHNMSNEVASALTTLRTWLKEARIPMSEADIERCRGHIEYVRKSASNGKANCDMVRETVLMKVDDQQRLLDVQAVLATQMHQLGIYERELDYIRQYAMEPPPFADLFIAEQPFPISIYHHKPLPSALRVRLHSSARAIISDIGVVNVELMHDAGLSKTMSDVVMQNNSKKMVDGESHDNEANFEQLTFDKGTRLQQVTLKFNQKIKLQAGTTAAASEHLESNASEPFIVTTHENQWAQAEGVLLERTLFAQQMSVSWPLFANAFQVLYLRATRQEADKVKRPLCVEEFGYLHAKLGSKRTIERAAWSELWKKLQDCLRKIRFAKHLCDMWNEGAIAGFLNRVDAERLLQNEPIGAFMIRFSDSADGSFVISFVLDEDGAKTIKHYLVTEQDTSTKKSLAEFVRSHPRLVYLVKVGVNSLTGLRSTSRELKDTALSKFYGKGKVVATPSHYEQRL